MSKCESISETLLRTSEEEQSKELQLATLAKALSHPARIRILRVLYKLETQGGCLNNDLVGQLGLAQSTVSEHLRILRQAGFVRSEPMPPKVCYRIELDALNSFKHLFDANF